MRIVVVVVVVLLVHFFVAAFVCQHRRRISQKGEPGSRVDLEERCVSPRRDFKGARTNNDVRSGEHEEGTPRDMRLLVRGTPLNLESSKENTSDTCENRFALSLLCLAATNATHTEAATQDSGLSRLDHSKPKASVMNMVSH